MNRVSLHHKNRKNPSWTITFQFFARIHSFSCRSEVVTEKRGPGNGSLFSRPMYSVSSPRPLPFTPFLFPFPALHFFKGESQGQLFQTSLMDAHEKISWGTKRGPSLFFFFGDSILIKIFFFFFSRKSDPSRSRNTCSSPISADRQPGRQL